MQNKEINRTFFNKWSKTYDNPLFQFWMKGFQRPVIKELKLNKNTKILDVSCGTGQFLDQLTGRARCYGIDLSEGMVRKAKEKLGLMATLKVANVLQLPFADNYFDYTVSTEAFHHYDRQKEALTEMVRVTKKKGWVIVSDINFFFRPIHWLFEKFEPGCVKVNRRKQMKELFLRAGLQVIKQKRNFLFAVVTIGKKVN